MGKAFRVLHPINPPVCLSMVSYESMPVNREESLSTPNKKKKYCKAKYFYMEVCFRTYFFRGGLKF